MDSKFEVVQASPDTYTMIIYSLHSRKKGTLTIDKRKESSVEIVDNDTWLRRGKDRRRKLAGV